MNSIDKILCSLALILLPLALFMMDIRSQDTQFIRLKIAGILAVLGIIVFGVAKLYYRRNKNG